jgi:DNA-binding transcriptional LysR family regulator
VVGEALTAAGMSRDIGLVVPSFLAALVTVATTDLFFAAPRQLVRPLLDGLGLVAAAPPVEVPALGIAAVWHERFDAEPASRFLRGLVVDALAELLADRTPRGRPRGAATPGGG